ncbi:prenyltransferase/squalene oxidase repeat-containing protein [Streptomyces cyaneofuscatus]|uniref:prenyltransferase/squalene oxidase repeat-containing protein n=1 Tax=Streptomyces cyaneofuscatus TaxID=66883 RepID=UPI0037A70773
MRTLSTPGLRPWPADALPSGLLPATRLLRLHLQGRVRADGGLHEPCESRVLESALMLALLDRTRQQPAARNRLAAYLRSQRDSPDVLDRLLARAALDRDDPLPPGALDVDQVLARAPDFTGPRKRALIHMVLGILGVPVADTPAPDAYSLTGLHTWAHVQVTAVKVVLGHHHTGPHQVTEADLDLLRSTQWPGTVWEGNLLIHLSVLHALAPLPGEHRLVSEGIRTALWLQRPDGGMPFIRDEDTWVTAAAGIALHAAGASAPVLDAIAGRLVKLEHPDGGWSYTEGARLTDVDCTSAALEVLHLADPHLHRTAIACGMRALRTVRGCDGGYPTYLAGAPSEASMTAAAVNALSIQGPAQDPAAEAALAYLASQQYDDGSFPPDWSRSRLHTVFRAALAATRHPGPPGSPAARITESTRQLVATTQNSDGGWGQQAGHRSDSLSTAYALITLAAHPTPHRAVTPGIAYLLAQQRADGSIAGIADSIGPRPFAFTVPLLTDVFSLLALGHLTRRLAPITAEHSPAKPSRLHSDPVPS